MIDVKEAIKVAFKIHENDKWGEYPYSVHLSLVAENLNPQFNYEKVRGIAYLHDAIEDHPEVYELIKEKFPEIIDSLMLLARDRNISYKEYINKIAESNNKEAIAVKVSDLSVNSSNNPPKSLYKRYAAALEKLAPLVNH